MSNIPEYHALIPYVKLSLKTGNTLSAPIDNFLPNSDGFYKDKDGWKCDSKHPLDFDLLLTKSPNIDRFEFDHSNNSIFDPSTWSEIRGDIN